MATASMLERDSSPIVGDEEENTTETLDQLPLVNVILCCTSILPEQRDKLCETAREMGAVTKLDLTSDVTHLIVGDVDTAKYKYVAKERPDVHVLQVAWLDALHQTWMDGNSVDLDEFDEVYRLPTFFNLRICITGFEDSSTRAHIAELVAQNGATYSGDLTKEVTHLVAAAPKGKKYTFAASWGVKIIAQEWLYQSVARRMALDESLYNPLTPQNERGKGAYKQLPPLPEARKRETQDQPKDAHHRRKLRRTTSSKLESQNDDLWADIGPSADQPGRSDKIAPAQTERPFETRPPQQQSRSIAALHQQHQPPATEEAPTPADGPFQHEQICIRGFAEARVAKLLEHLEANGASIVSWEALREAAAQTRTALTFLIPHDADQSLLEEVEQAKRPGDALVSEWWVEKCIFNRGKISKDRTDCKPLRTGTIPDFPKIKVCPTSFAGIDLMHFSKAMKLVGAQYEETLTGQTTILVSGSKSAAPEGNKIPFAISHRIPIVDESWAWNCIIRRQLLSYERYLIPGQDRTSLQQRSFLSTSRSQQTKAMAASKKAEATTASRALREITPHANSQSASQRSAEGETMEDVMRHAKAPQLQSMTNEDRSTTPAVTDGKGDKDSEKGTNKDRLQDALSKIQRSKKGEETASAPSGSRKHRQLGRLQSNPPSFNAKSASEPAPSFKTAEEEDEEERENKASTGEVLHGGFRPSQKLSYENEESTAAREQLLKARAAGLDGSVDESESGTTAGRQRVERVGVVRDKEQRRPIRKATRRRDEEETSFWS